MRVRRRLALGSIGCALVLSWTFRLLVIYWNRFFDPFLLLHLSVACFSLLAGGYLLRLALQRRPMSYPQHTLLLVFALGMVMSWFWRVYVILSDLSHDANPRAHLHLAALLILLSVYLAWVGWKGRQESHPPPP